jgi:hypothetical protein
MVTVAATTAAEARANTRIASQDRVFGECMALLQHLRRTADSHPFTTIYLIGTRSVSDLLETKRVAAE